MINWIFNYIQYEDELTNEINKSTKENSYQLEQWCNLYCDEIIFDSDKDNWSKRTSTLNEIIKGRSHLVFVIEDDNNEQDNKNQKR